jgi:hypothetical protein
MAPSPVLATVTDQLVGITIVNAKWLLDRDGRVTVTAGEPISVDRTALAAAIGAA